MLGLIIMHIQLAVLLAIIIILILINRKEPFEVIEDRLNRYRPFNSTATLTSESDRSIEFDNSVVDLWNIPKPIEDKCIPFQNINQCMTECSSDDCIGFYLNEDKCCMMAKNNYDQTTARPSLNDLIRESRVTEDKIVFDRVSNNTFVVPFDRKRCNQLCPKCILGKCPDNYRCSGLTADPRYNYSCIVTNHAGYDEKQNKTYDDDTIQYLDSVFGLEDYPGYQINH